MIELVEGICYLYPHKEELVASSLSMKAVWSNCLKALKENKNSFLAPLLVDDLKRPGFITYQTAEELIKQTTGKDVNCLPWFGKQILESGIDKQYGNLGCKIFDSIFHRDVISSLNLIDPEWKWTAIHPVYFKNQQEGMLEQLWKLLSANVLFSEIGNNSMVEKEKVRREIKKKFLSHFNHIWIDTKGNIKEKTMPEYSGKKIIHTAI